MMNHSQINTFFLLVQKCRDLADLIRLVPLVALSSLWRRSVEMLLCTEILLPVGDLSDKCQ